MSSEVIQMTENVLMLCCPECDYEYWTIETDKVPQKKEEVLQLKVRVVCANPECGWSGSGKFSGS